MNGSMLLFLIAALTTVATPGPTALLALHNGARLGWHAALPGIAGAMASDLLLIAASAAGLSTLLASSAAAFALLRWAGVAYLCWLGLGLLRGHRSAPTDTAPAATQAHHRTFARSLAVALGNPKGYLFFAALLPQFIDPAMPQALQYAKLALAFAAVDGLVMAGYAALGAQGARRLEARGLRQLEQAGGLAMLCMAATLALVRQAPPSPRG